MLLDELVNGHEASADANNQIVVLDFHNDFLSEVAVMTGYMRFIFSDKQALHTLFRVALVYEFG